MTGARSCVSAQRLPYLLEQRYGDYHSREAWGKGVYNFLQILNVQVPFYFKNIVDSMNIDFAAVGGTAYTVAGAMIIAC
jgi:ABC transporter ATM